MITAILVFLAASAVAVVLTPLVRDLAHRYGAVDHALTSRKVHVRPIPRLGGLAIVAGFFAALSALCLLDPAAREAIASDRVLASGVVFGGLAIAALGVWDDLKGANAKTKFSVQFAVAALMYASGFRIDAIALPFGGPPIALGLLALPFTMVWIAGVVNAINLIDGLDGLAGGVALIAATTTCVLAALRGDVLMVVFTAALAGAVLGFLFYNFNPASIFMGDTGSMFLGFILATTAIETNRRSPASVSLVVPIIVLGVPIADTLLAMARRAVRGVPMFSADRGHIHHRLLGLGLSHRATVLTMYVVSAALSVVAVAVAHASPGHALGLLATLAPLLFLGLRRLGFMELAKAQRLLEQRKRNLHLRAEIRRIGEALRETRSVAQVWVAARIARVVLGASAIALHLEDEDGEGERALSHGFDGAGPDLFRARYSLLVERQGGGVLELGWSDGRTTVDRDTEIAVELLCEHVSVALARLAHSAAVPELETLRAVN